VFAKRPHESPTESAGYVLDTEGRDGETLVETVALLRPRVERRR
jgi:hypothetical protein